MTLLERNAADSVYFNDIVPSIAEKLTANLNNYFSDLSKWTVECKNASEIILPSNQSNLVVIAGVGGDRFIEIMRGISAHNPGAEFDVIACTVHHNYRVRTFLSGLKYKLVGEALVKDNKRFYEVIYGSQSAEGPISNIGAHIWREDAALAKEYLNANLHYLSNEVKSGNEYYKKLLAEYQTVFIEES